MIYVILGMHKSGTTLVSQILHHSGINMGDDIDPHISYSQGNQYERESTWLLNEDILGHQPLEVESIDTVAPDILQLTDAQRTGMHKIINECNEKYADWGFKDPRTCLTYPLWASELPQHKIIVIYRSPNELWQRYRPKHLYNRYLDPYVAWKLMCRWSEHNVNIMTYLQNTQVDFLVLEYRKLMSTQAEFDRLQAFVGMELNDRRRKDLYRHKSTKQFLSLNLATWLVRKQTKYDPVKIFEQLETLRETTTRERHDNKVSII